MPNWCENVVTIAAVDEATARGFFEAMRAGKPWFTVPNVICPRDDVPATGGDANTAEWTGEHRAVDGRIWISGRIVEMRWGSRWSPPIPFYEALEALGFEVQAAYFEPGMCFCGTYEDGHQHNVEYDADRSVIPAAVEAEWGCDLDWIFEDQDEEA